MSDRDLERVEIELQDAEEQIARLTADLDIIESNNRDFEELVERC